MSTRPRIHLLPLLVLALAGDRALLAQGPTGHFPFEPADVVGAAQSAQGARLTDLDDDGLPDVVCITRNGLNGQVTALMGQGDGTFAVVAGSSTTEQATVQAVADLTGDGELDLLVGAFNVWLHEGNGDGSFDPAVKLDEGQHMRAADLDGDGDVDLAVGDNAFFPGFPDDLTVRLHLNDGSGGFTLAQSLPAGDAFLDDLELADLDGDDAADVFALLDDDTLLRWTSDGNGGWVPAAAPSFPAGLATVEFADLDDDGDVDLVGLTSAAVHSRLGQGDGTFGALASRAVAATAVAVETGDLDGDGVLDLAVVETAGFLQGEVELLHGAGDGGFDASTHLSPGGPVGFALVADVDGDGVSDVVAARPLDDLLVFEQRDYSGTPWSDLGDALRGSDDWPVLLADGPLTAGSALTLDVHLASGPFYLVLGFGALGLPFKGGTLHPAPDIVIAGLVPPASGSVTLPITWPSGLPGGFPLVAQVWIPDGAGVFGFAATQGVRGEVP